MKNLLVVAYYFPPSGGPGVQRVLKHVKYLPEFGWQPYVLTVRNAHFPVLDSSLMNEIPSGLIVERTPIPEPYSIYRKFTGKRKTESIDVNVIHQEGLILNLKERLSESIRANFFIPDARIGWYPFAVKAGSRLIKKFNIDAIYSSSPPYTCSLIGLRLSQKFGLPWISGFRDPWSGFISTPKRKCLAKAIELKLEKKVFKHAKLVECAWEGIIKDALAKFPDLDPHKFHVIPNGFDPSDFPETEASKNERFTITYSGSLYGRRNPASFIQAIEAVIRDRIIGQQDILIRFIGRFGAEIAQVFNNSPVRENVEILTYLPHEESIRHLGASDALLLIVDDAPESLEIIPGKVYEYMGSGRPIIALTQDGSAVASLIDQTNSGFHVDPNDIEAMVKLITMLYHKWKEGTDIIQPNIDEIKKFHRREAARNLSSLLTQISE